MPPKAAKSKEAPAERPIFGRFSSHLKIGIVGLPNVGKSTLFNTLTKMAIPAENFPFCTIEPNEARVNVPDERFEWLCQLYKPKSEVSAFLEIHDIAGLVRGAHQGQGLGNSFLSHIRAVDGIFHVLRAFEDPDIIHVDDTVDPVRDLEVITEELRLKDVEFIERKIEDVEKSMKRSNDKQLKIELECCQKVKSFLGEGKDIRLGDWKAADIEILNSFQLLTAKPVVYLVNMTEKDYQRKKNKFLPKIHAWLLVSFSGKYLKYEYCVPSPHNWTGNNISCAFDNQLYKIYVPHTEESLFGPAFIEVENESGLSNFIPVLIGDKEICTEMKTLQQKLDVYLLSEQFQFASVGSICSLCQAFALRHMSSSDLLVDIAWLLKDPTSGNFDRVMTASQIQRYCYLLDFLICNDSKVVLGKILPNLMILTESMKSNMVTNRIRDIDMSQLLKCMHNARDFIYQKHQKGGGKVMHSEMEGFKVPRGYQDNMPSVAINSQGIMSIADAKLGVLRSSTSNDKNESIPLLKREIIMNVGEFPKTSCHRYLARGFLSSRPAIFMIVSVAVCLGLCVAVLHHGRVSELAVSIRRCLFNN